MIPVYMLTHYVYKFVYVSDLMDIKILEKTTRVPFFCKHILRECSFDENVSVWKGELVMLVS